MTSRERRLPWRARPGTGIPNDAHHDGQGRKFSRSIFAPEQDTLDPKTPAVDFEARDFPPAWPMGNARGAKPKRAWSRLPYPPRAPGVKTDGPAPAGRRKGAVPRQHHPESGA
jgi:hypothetical protein